MISYPSRSLVVKIVVSILVLLSLFGTTNTFKYSTAVILLAGSAFVILSGRFGQDARLWAYGTGFLMLGVLVSGLWQRISGSSK